MNISNNTADKKIVHVYLLSDSTGETVNSLCRAVFAQFSSIETNVHVWTLMKEKRQIDQVLDYIKEPSRTLIMYTLINQEIINHLENKCKKQKIAHISILDPLLKYISQQFHASMSPKSGSQHHMNQEYFDRISAMEFTLAHDDGVGLHNIHNAEVILVGASRTSKTPTTVYLANRGIRAANVPFVHGIPLPSELDNLPPEILVIGLTKDPRQLSHVRKTRMTMISGLQTDSSYDDLRQVRDEVRACKELCLARGWDMIDVSHRSIEETAAAVIRKLQIHRHDLDKNS